MSYILEDCATYRTTRARHDGLRLAALRLASQEHLRMSHRSRLAPPSRKKLRWRNPHLQSAAPYRALAGVLSTNQRAAAGQLQGTTRYQRR